MGLPGGVYEVESLSILIGEHEGWYGEGGDIGEEGVWDDGEAGAESESMVIGEEVGGGEGVKEGGR